MAPEMTAKNCRAGKMVAGSKLWPVNEYVTRVTDLSDFTKLWVLNGFCTH